MHAKTTSAKTTLTKRTRRWTYSALRYFLVSKSVNAYDNMFLTPNPLEIHFWQNSDLKNTFLVEKFERLLEHLAINIEYRNQLVSIKTGLLLGNIKMLTEMLVIIDNV